MSNKIKLKRDLSSKIDEEKDIHTHICLHILRFICGIELSKNRKEVEDYGEYNKNKTWIIQ